MHKELRFYINYGYHFLIGLNVHKIFFIKFNVIRKIYLKQYPLELKIY